MRVLVAGAAGVIGSRLVPLPRAVGHDVVGPARSADRNAAAAAAGAEAAPWPTRSTARA
ncbi:NAD-dependent epimerase/dehydratase family protein [Streptomyces sp. NPDC001070]